MSLRIKTSELSTEQLTQLYADLTMTPVITGKKFQRGPYGKVQKPDPVYFYQLDGEHIRLPFSYAASLLKVASPNMHQRYALCDFAFTGTLRDYQVSIANEAWQQLVSLGSSTLALDPGMGKTALGAWLSVKAGLLTVVIIHREILGPQWRKSYENVTNARTWIVGEKHIPERCDVVICMDTRVHLLSSEFRAQVGMVIIDEAHCFCTPSRVSCLLAFSPRYILLESASLEREDEMHTMMYALAGAHGVYREPDKTFTVMKILTNTQPERKKTRFGEIDYCALVRNTLFDDRRNHIILQLVKGNTQCKILVLTSLVDHATYLNDEILKMGIKSDRLCGTDKKYQDATVLVGTVSKIGTGFDPANFCATYDGRPFDLLILVCSMKKYSMLIQNIGRVFRSPNPTVFHLVDADPTFQSHWTKAKKWYLMRGAKLVEHSIPNPNRTTPTSERLATHQQSWAKAKADGSKTLIKGDHPLRVDHLAPQPKPSGAIGSPVPLHGVASGSASSSSPSAAAPTQSKAAAWAASKVKQLSTNHP